MFVNIYIYTIKQSRPTHAYSQYKGINYSFKIPLIEVNLLEKEVILFA